MADLKISQLTALATFADDDLLVIVDTSAVETKKVAWSSVKTALATAFGISVASTAIAVGTGSAIVGYVSDFYYSNATGEFNVSSAASNTYLHVNPASGQYQFGDIDVTGNKLYISDSGLITLSAGQGLYVNMSGANRLTTIGDSDFNGNGTYIRVNDATQVATFSSRAITIGSLAYIFPASQSANTFLKTDGSGNLTWAAAGSGTVTSFSAGDLSPLFTTSEANPTTTPALTFTLNTQNANKVFAGPTTGADAAPTFRALVAADIPSLSGTYLTIDGATTGATSQAQVFTVGVKTPFIDDNAAGTIEMTISSVVKATFSAQGMNVSVAGSAAVPSLSLTGNLHGFYEKSATELGVSIGAALVGGFDATGVFVGLAGTLTGTLKFNGATSGTVTIQSAAAAGTWTLTLPTTDGNSGEFLQTNGSGVTTWAVPAGTGANTALSNLASVAINTTLLPGSNDGAALGSATLSFSDLFLASGAVVNFANGNSVLTHSSGILTVSTGDLRVTTAGTDATSVVTLAGTQTLTNKSIVATQLTGTAYTMAVNNTSGTAPYTLVNYQDEAIATYGGTFTWTGSASPTTIVSQQFKWQRIGSFVILTVSVLYTSAGTANTACIITLPATCPNPAVIANSGDAASEYMYPICGGRVEANQTANPSAIRGGIRRNSGDTAFEILTIFGSVNALHLQMTIIYPTA